MLYSKISYKVIDFTRYTEAITFRGERLNVLLPASIDMYLSGGKTHDSEIRLTRFLIQNLEWSHVFMDVGAHFGFYTLLASHLLVKGTVYSVEAASRSFEILKRNIEDKSNMVALNIAITEDDKPVEFYKFPTMYSEFNALENNQYANEGWYNSREMVNNTVKGKKGDTLIRELSLTPDFIKMVVEGAEDRVIRGFRNFLEYSVPIVVMEFSKTMRGNANHLAVDTLGKDFEYRPYLIDKEGQLKKIETKADL